MKNAKKWPKGNFKDMSPTMKTVWALHQMHKQKTQKNKSAGEKNERKKSTS